MTSLGVDPAVADGRGHRDLQHFDVVVGHLQRPVRRQGRAARLTHIEASFEHTMAVRVHRACHLLAVAHPHDQSTPRQGAVVDADHVAFGRAHRADIPQVLSAGSHTRIVDGPRLAQL